MKKLLFSVSLISMGLAASAKVEPASIIGDNMVIQQQTDVHLWGNATPGAELTVSPSWSGVPVKGKVGADGKWEISIPDSGGKLHAADADNQRRHTADH